MPYAEAVPGRTPLGLVAISDGVVAKIAARAASEVPDAGASASTVLGVNLAAVGVPGVRSTELGGLPKVEATVDGATVVVALVISVRWPTSVAQVTEAVREHVRRRVSELTGLHVVDIRITVSYLATSLAVPPRVR